MNKRIRFGVALGLLLGLMSVLPWQAPRDADAANLLRNGSFEDGYAFQDGIPELAVPNGWRLHYIDGGTFAGIADGAVARRPESVVWSRGQAPANEQGLFWRDGDYVVKLFKPWAPVYFGMSQDVDGLVVGQEYEFVANVYVDVIEYYNNQTKVPPSNEPEGVGIRLGSSNTNVGWRDESRINYGPYTMAANTSPFHLTYHTIRHRFTATSSRMTVWMEMYSRYGYSNNGFFMDDFTLNPTGNTGVSPTNTPRPTGTAAGTTTPGATPTAIPTLRPTGTPAPTQTVAPTATAQPTYVEYTVVPGDRLSRIATRFGVSMVDIARANNITNYSLIYVGTVLRIPVTDGSGQPAVTATPPPGVTPSPTPAGGSGSTGGSGGAQTYVVQAGDRMSTISQKLGVPYQLLVQANNLANPNLIYVGQVLVVPDAARIHVVQTGDRLSQIAASYGVTVAAIVQANNLRSADLIYVGQILTIP